MADTLKVGGGSGTALGLEDVALSGGYGYVRVVALDWGTPALDQFLDPRPLADGMMFRGQVNKERTFTLGLYVSGAGSWAKGQDNWQVLNSIFRVDGGSPLRFWFSRSTGAGGTQNVELLGVPVGTPGWAGVRGGAPGIRPNGNLLYNTTVMCPYPWPRQESTDAETDHIHLLNAAADHVHLTRTGTRPCGVKVQVETDGSLAEVTISDAVRTMTLSATFGASAKGVDWYYTDPTATSIDSGVTLSIPAHLSLHSAETVMTCTPGAGSTGNHVVTFSWLPTFDSV